MSIRLALASASTTWVKVAMFRWLAVSVTARASAKAIFLVMVAASSSGSMSLEAAATARQNLTTLVADVPQDLASSEMLRQATPAGSSRTIRATRREVRQQRPDGDQDADVGPLVRSSLVFGHAVR